jgi:hypothetical protein
MPRSQFIKEHKNLLKVLKRGDPKELMKEHADQKAELAAELKGGRGRASGFIMRMMAENKLKHKGQYKNPTAPLAPESKMNKPVAFDLERLANAKQKPGGKNKKAYGASPFIMRHFGSPGAVEFVPRAERGKAAASAPGETAAQKEARLRTQAEGLLEKAAELAAVQKKPAFVAKPTIAVKAPAPESKYDDDDDEDESDSEVESVISEDEALFRRENKKPVPRGVSRAEFKRQFLADRKEAEAAKKESEAARKSEADRRVRKILRESNEMIQNFYQIRIKTAMAKAKGSALTEKQLEAVDKLFKGDPQRYQPLGPLTEIVPAYRPKPDNPDSPGELYNKFRTTGEGALTYEVPPSALLPTSDEANLKIDATKEYTDYSRTNNKGKKGVRVEQRWRLPDYMDYEADPMILGTIEPVERDLPTF